MTQENQYDPGEYAPNPNTDTIDARRMQNKNRPALLVGVQSGAAILEDSRELSCLAGGGAKRYSHSGRQPCVFQARSRAGQLTLCFQLDRPKACPDSR